VVQFSHLNDNYKQSQHPTVRRIILLIYALDVSYLSTGYM